MTRIGSFVLLATMLPASLAAQTTAPAGAAPPVVVTHGEATVKKAPDRAWLTVATETRDPQAAEARRKNALAMTAVQTALRATGLATDAIRTTGYSLTQDIQWSNGRSTPRGYIARNQIDVRIDDLDKLGEVIDAANSAKAAPATVVGPRFDLKNAQAAESDALRQAVELAMSRARAMAAGAGRQLGAVVRIEESGGRSPAPMPMAVRSFAPQAADANVETPVTPGDIDVRAEVTVTVELR